MINLKEKCNSCPSGGLKRVIIVLFCFIAFSGSARSQSIYNTSPDYYSLSMKRLLAQYVGNYINQVTQGQLDLDSATAMACEIYHINKLLPYSAGFDGGQITNGMLLIGSGKIAQAKNQLNLLKSNDRLQRLCELEVYYLFKTNTSRSDLDSAKYFNDALCSIVGSMKSAKWETVCNDLFGKYYAKIGDLKESQTYFQKNVMKALIQKNEPSLAAAMYTQASYLPFSSPTKLKLLQQSLSLSQKLNLRVLAFQILTDIFTLHFMLSNKLIDKEIVQILQIEKAIGFRHQQYTYNVYSYMAIGKADFIAALQYAQQSIKYMHETGDNALSALFYQRMGDALTFLSEKDQAIIWYQKAIDAPKTKQTQVFWYKSFIDETSTLFMLNRNREALALIQRVSSRFPPTNNFDQMDVYYLRGKAYHELGDYSKAETQLNLFLQMADNYPIEYIHNVLPDGYILMADNFCAQKKFTLAKVYYEKTVALNKIFKNVVTKLNLYKTSFKIDSATGKKTAAIRDYQAYKIMFDSINNTAVRQKYDELKVQYETVNKDRNIKFLKQANELQNTKIKEDNYFKKMTIGVIILISIIASLLYYLYRAKQHSNIKLKSQQRVLENLITEKEWLVKEIHHRVKNNLHTIVSLLESQSAYLHNDDALAAVRDSQHRVHAMSLIHQKLYMGANMTSIKSDEYIKELVNYLKDSFKLGNVIMFKIDVEHIALDVSQAIPLGLIINEAITNSIKYAFKKSGGNISISLNKIDHSYLLKIADNGDGLPDDFNVNDRSKSLGMSLIAGLTKEIGGEFNISGRDGTTVYILFPPFDIFTQGFNDKNK